MTTFIMGGGERIVHIAAQYCPVRPRYHAEHAQRVLVVVLVVSTALAAYQHAAAATPCPQVLRIGRPRGASEVTALFHQLASAARNAAGVPGPLVVSDVLRPTAVAIRAITIVLFIRAGRLTTTCLWSVVNSRPCVHQRCSRPVHSHHP